MNLSSVRPDDIVFCDVRGDRFYALVREPKTEVQKEAKRKRGGLQIASLTGRPIPALFVTARQVLAHYRKSPKSKV